VNGTTKKTLVIYHQDKKNMIIPIQLSKISSKEVKDVVIQ
jgi:hypothetical protein